MRKAEWSAVVALLACALLTGAWQQPPEPAKATMVIHYTPPATLPDTGRSGYCWVGSIAAPYRADAWRCMEGNAIHDPCFSLADQKAVVCGANPATGNRGFRMTLANPLLKNQVSSAPSDHPWPWLIELNDGTTCMQFTGTAPFVDGQVGHDGCASHDKEQQTLLLGELDNSKPMWTAKKATLVKSGSEWTIKSSESVPVKAVWQ